jgi:L-cysteine desulfidase
MKKALSIITIAAVVVACNSNPQQEIGDANVSAMKAIDTVGLAEYHTWKAQKDMADFNEYKQSKQSIAAGNVASQPALRKAAKNSTARPVKAKKPAVQSGSGSAGTTTSYPAKAPEKKDGVSPQKVQ